MAHIAADRVKETTTTTGTGNVTLAGAVTGFKTFASRMANNDTCFYCIAGGSEWEVGLGTLVSATPALARTTVLRSSNADAAVNFSAGTKDVFITAPADKAVVLNNVDAQYLPTVTTDPSASPPTDGLLMYAKNRAGRVLPFWRGPSGLDTPMQAALSGNTVTMWLPGNGATLAINFGVSFTARNSGTSAAQTTPALASTNALKQMKRAAFGTGTTTTGASGIQSTSTVAWRGNAAGLGGFFFGARFGIETLASDQRAFVGLSANNAAMAADASTWNNTIGIEKGTADSVWQLVQRGTSATRTSTGCTVTAGQVLDLYLFCKPNDSKITARVLDPVTGTVYIDNVDLSTTLPAATTFMYMQAHTQSVTGTTAKLLALNKMYLETDL